MKNSFLLFFILCFITYGANAQLSFKTKLQPPSTGTGQQGGKAVAISEDGDVVAFSAPFSGNIRGGILFIYERNSSNQFVQRGNAIYGPQMSGTGSSLDITGDGSVLVAGAGVQDNGNGAVYVRSGSLTPIFTGSVQTKYVGKASAISDDGNTIVFRSADSVWIFTNSGSGWAESQNIALTSPDNPFFHHHYNQSVDVSSDGNTIAVGIPAYNSDKGGVAIYVKSGSQWQMQGSILSASDATASAGQGTSVSLSSNENTLAVGGPTHNSDTGGAWIFTRSGTTWSQQGNVITGAGGSGKSKQGHSVALSGNGNVLLIGAPADNADAGAIWEFQLVSGSWSQIGSKIQPSTDPIEFGYSLDIAGDGATAVAGAISDGQPGSAYIYEKTSSGVKENIALKVNIFPNPASEWVSISVPNENAIKDIAVYDSRGSSIMVIAQLFEEGFSVKDLPEGLYLLHINTDRGIATKKIIIIR